MINPAERIRDLYTCITVATSDCDSALELGCGFGEKLACVRCDIRVGVDSFEPYLKIAIENWGRRIYFVCEDMLQFASKCTYPFECILLIDALEHIEKDQGLELLRVCKSIAKRRIVLFGPEGECPQDRDPYEMGGDVVQTHKSTWTAEELRVLDFRTAVWEHFHEDRPNRESAVFAIWEPWIR